MSLTELRGISKEEKPPVTINPITKEPTKYYDTVGIFGIVLKGGNGRYKIRHRY